MTAALKKEKVKNRGVMLLNVYLFFSIQKTFQPWEGYIYLFFKSAYNLGLKIVTQPIYSSTIPKLYIYIKFPIHI
jgi:hypothetical protein